MTHVSETTPLLKENSDSTFKIYNRKNRSFYICLFAAIGVLVFIAFVAAIWYIFELKSENTKLQNEKDLNILLQNQWPRSTDTQALILPYASLLTLINEAVDEGKQQLKVRQLQDENITPLDSDSPTLKHQQSIVYSQLGSNLSDYGYIEAAATKYLREKGVQNVINYDSATDLKWANETDCHRYNESTPCESTPYRSISGSCNNLKHPQKWGVAMTPFRRSLAPDYEDAVSVPRGGFETSSLPSARDVSAKIHRPVYQKDEDFTVMLAVWGQFMDHDITATALSRGINGTPITCCNSKNKHPECFPVLIKPDDPYYGQFNLSCMEFVRSAPALRCSFGPREQLNQASSYIDGSMIYGNTENLAERLRTFNNGELELLRTKDGRTLLPVSTDPDDGCNQLEEIKKGKYCFLSGDTRANENTHLTSIHLILARHHNNISNQLREINPFWDDETLYQEARRIVISQLQHITYNEFLPGVLGERLMEKLELYSYKSGYWTKYDANIDATISNNFASASFRFAHTLIPRMMKLLANDTESPEYIEMHKMLFNPFSLHDGELDSIIRGALNTSAEKADNFFTEQLTKHLFEPTSMRKSSKKSFGLDLVSLNIQRGRDHGLPSYVEWREYCNLSKVSTYDDLKGIFDEESLNSVSALYKSVQDIDLYTGGLSEIPIAGGLLGPTLTCQIADQFYRLKHGDRFWYETNEKPQSFTPEQLDEIRKSSLAGIICQNTDDLQMVTPAVMRSAKDNNEHVPCSQIPQPNISVWQENPEKNIGFNITHIRIEFPKRVFTWNNQSAAQLPSKLLANSRLMSIVASKQRFNQNNVVELKGTFTFVTENGKELHGLFEMTAETSSYWNINSARIKFPIYVSDNDTDSNISNSSRIIIHATPISSGKLVWTGKVTINLIPLFWNNATEHSRPNKTNEDEFKKSENSSPKSKISSTSEKTSHRGAKEYPEDSNFNFDEKSKFAVPTKRVQSKDSGKQYTKSKETEGNKFQHREQAVNSSFSRHGEDEYPKSNELNDDKNDMFAVPTERAEDLTFKSNAVFNETDENEFQDTERSTEIPNPSADSEISRDQQSDSLKFDEKENIFATNKRTHDSTLKKDYKFFKKNGTASEEDEEDTDEIHTSLPDFTSTDDSAHEDNILYYILKHHKSKPSNETTLEEDELNYLHELWPNSSVYMDSTPQPSPVEEQIIPVNISANQVEISNHPVLNPPIDIPSSSVENKTVTWDFNSMDPLSGSFQINNKSGSFKIKYDNGTNNDFRLDPDCKYYSKIIFDKPTDESTLFDVDVEGVPDGCTVIAPLQLQGKKISPESFSWDGNVTVHVRKHRQDLNKENELSLHLKPKQILNFENIMGTVSTSEGLVWNGTLPAVFQVDNLGWTSSKYATAYPIFWSGDYEDSDFVGNFIVLKKIKDTVQREEGKFSIKVPDSNTIRNLIKPFSMYESLIYLTEKLSHIHELDVSQFDEIDEWDSNSALRIILLGKFAKDEFVWSGNVTIIAPEDIQKTNDSDIMLTYRPRGKYLATIFDATLFALLDDTSDILKWWSGILPSTVIIPAGLPQLETYKLIFNKAIQWSYEEKNDFGLATFRTYGNHSNIHLFGDFEFKAVSLFDNIKTSSLKPNVTYYSPIVLQGEKKVYNTDTDLITKLNNLRDLKAGLFAPIMLLGNFTENDKFMWNLQCIVHVEDN